MRYHRLKKPRSSPSLQAKQRVDSSLLSLEISGSNEERHDTVELICF